MAFGPDATASRGSTPPWSRARVGPGIQTKAQMQRPRDMPQMAPAQKNVLKMSNHWVWSGRCIVLSLSLCTTSRLAPWTRGSFFFPASAYWPVWPGQSTVLFRKRDRNCTGPFNWGEAHCAGENVKRRIGPFLQKSLKHQPKTNQQQNGHSPPRQPGTPRPGSQVHGPGSKRPKEHKRLQRQIQVRLNVHRNVKLESVRVQRLTSQDVSITHESN